jgi:uncharacterized protein (DUF4415 family)
MGIRYFPTALSGAMNCRRFEPTGATAADVFAAYPAASRIACLTAVIVFDDDRAITLLDEHPTEERYATFGIDAQGRAGSFPCGSRRHHADNLGTQGDRPRAGSVPGQTNMKREYDLSKGKRGPVIPLPAEKVRITIRLDRDIVDHFRDQARKAHRGNHQTLINDALRDYLHCPSVAQQVGAEVRSVLREELEKVKVRA